MTKFNKSALDDFSFEEVNKILYIIDPDARKMEENKQKAIESGIIIRK